LRARFAAMLQSAAEAPVDDALRDLAALAPLRAYPARHKCAMLPFATARAALAGLATASTESGATYVVSNHASG
jgi:nitrogen fixation NifU-like protein